MKHAIFILIGLLSTLAVAGEPFYTITNFYTNSGALPNDATPVHPEMLGSPSLWRALAKVDPPEDWGKVITPMNRDKYPTSFTLFVHTNGSAATFDFTYTATNLELMLPNIELFEPDPNTLDSPRAEAGLVSIILRTRSTDISGGTRYNVTFTYPTSRVNNAYLRVKPTFRERRLWPISLFEFMKKPDSHQQTPATETEININF